jgi:hypothetical protein
MHMLEGESRSLSFDSACNISYRSNNSFRDNIININVSPFMQGSVWHCLYDDVSSNISYFYFLFFFFPHLQIHVGHSTSQSCPLIY